MHVIVILDLVSAWGPQRFVGIWREISFVETIWDGDVADSVVCVHVLVCFCIILMRTWLDPMWHDVTTCFESKSLELCLHCLGSGCTADQCRVAQPRALCEDFPFRPRHRWFGAQLEEQNTVEQLLSQPVKKDRKNRKVPTGNKIYNMYQYVAKMLESIGNMVHTHAHTHMHTCTTLNA